jgi:FdhD protein
VPRAVAIERLSGTTREPTRDRVAVEASLELRARGAAVATILRTPGHDLELVAGLLHAESIAGAVAQTSEDVVEIDVDASAFAGRGVLATAACGVCGRAEIADLELRARECSADTSIDRALIARLPGLLASAQSEFAQTGGLHGAALVTAATGVLAVAREDVGRHNAVDKVVGYALAERLEPAHHALVLSGRAGYELLVKAIRLGVPVVASVSAPSSLAIDLAERFNVTLVGFVRGDRCNVYAHGWRVR